MVESTDLDLAIAVALAGGNEVSSDDDFRPTAPRVGSNRQPLVQTCPVSKKKRVKKAEKKHIDSSLGGRSNSQHCVEDLGKDSGRQKKVRRGLVKENTDGETKHSHGKSVVNPDINRPTSMSAAELDKFRFRGCSGNPPFLAITASFVNDDVKSEVISTTRLDPITELGNCTLPGVANARCGSAAVRVEDCTVMDIGTEVVVDPNDESQFSVLLRLCDEEHRDQFGVDSINVALLNRKPFGMVPAPSKSQAIMSIQKREILPVEEAAETVESILEENVLSISLTETSLQGLDSWNKDLPPDTHETHDSKIDISIQPGNIGGELGSNEEFCEDDTDYISSMMTQKCVSPVEKIKAPHRTSPLPLQNIINLAPRLDVPKQRAKVKSFSQPVGRVDSICNGIRDPLEKVDLGSVLLSHAKAVLNPGESYPVDQVLGLNVVGLAGKDANPQVHPQSREVREASLPCTDGLGEKIKCPVCSVNLSGLSVEQRVTHTNSCLDMLDRVEDCPEKDVQIDPCSVPALDKVREWLESLQLSRYVSLFEEQEIDWDTLRWLTEEDLVLVGINAVGPRRKILRALEDLKGESGGSGSDPAEDTSRNSEPKCPSADSTCRVPKASGEDSTNLITNYFPLPPNSAKNPIRLSESNKVQPKVQGVFKNKAAKRPRSSGYKTVSGIPAWMCIPGTTFMVDAFQHANADCSHWFLTHFHTDHYQGLTRGFRYGRIYCSLITARLVNLRIGVSWDKLMIIPLNEKCEINGVNVTFIDANHCPGSVMILFEPSNGEAVLHTGDFRFCSAMANNSLLQSLDIHTLILDTTYCNPQYDFPTQDTVVRFVIDAIQAEAFNSDTLFLIGTYTIGKERVFLEVAKVLKKFVYVGTAKKKLLDCMDLPADDTQWLTCNEQESFIHVVPLWSISSFKRMSSISRHYGGKYKLIVAFSPSGWSFGRGKKKLPGKRWKQGTMIRYEVPYSEHSSFSELKEFLKFIGPEDIIPSVPDKSCQSTEEMIARLWSDEK